MPLIHLSIYSFAGDASLSTGQALTKADSAQVVINFLLRLVFILFVVGTAFIIIGAIRYSDKATHGTKFKTKSRSNSSSNSKR